jgi:hypothetical protein
MSDFFEKHGTVILLYSLVLLAFGTTIVVGWKMGMEVKEVFAFAAGFTGGAFAGLTVAMRVSPAATQAPTNPVPPVPPVEPKP